MADSLSVPTTLAEIKRLSYADLIDVLRQLPIALDAYVQEATIGGLWPHRTYLYPVALESWPVPEIIGHLCDSARIWGYRLRCLVYDHQIPLEMFDVNYAERVSAYYLRPVASILQEYRLLLQGTAQFLMTVNPQQWAEVYTNFSDGTQTFHDFVTIELHHEHMHVHQDVPQNVATVIRAIK